MKDARDIRLIGIGLVAGLVLGYFLNFDERRPATGPATMTLARTARAVTQPYDNPQSGVQEVTFGSHTWMEGLAPNANERRLRIVPARQMSGQFPGGPAEYDLIDLDYIPDFKLPPD